MFQNTIPVFENKRLLKKEMLENLRDYPRNMFNIIFQNYSNGILNGCDLKAGDKNVKIQPGILYFKGIPYFLDQPYQVPCHSDGKLEYLKVRFLDRTLGAEKEEYLTQIYIDETEPDIAQEIELGRFKLQPGARLRTEYMDFDDYVTEFDTVNRIHVPYAAPEHSSILPQLLRRFAKDLLQLGTDNALDCAFCMNCLNEQDVVPYRMIKAYLDIRLEQEREYTNIRIYEALKSILREDGKKKGYAGNRNRKGQDLLML